MKKPTSGGINLINELSKWRESKLVREAGGMVIDSLKSRLNEQPIGSGGAPADSQPSGNTYASNATTLPPPGKSPATMNDLPPAQLSDYNNKAFYMEFGADLTTDLPDGTGGSRRGLQTGSFAEQKVIAPTFSINLESIRTRCGNIDKSRYFVKYKIALDSIYQQIDAALAPSEASDPSNPNRDTLYKAEPVYLISPELQGSGERYFVRSPPGQGYLPNLDTTAFSTWDDLPCQITFSYPCFLDVLPFDTTPFYANSPRIDGTRDLSTGAPMANPFYSCQFIRKFNIRFIVTTEVTPNMRVVYSVGNAENAIAAASAAAEAAQKNQQQIAENAPMDDPFGGQQTAKAGGGSAVGSGSGAGGDPANVQANLQDHLQQIHDHFSAIMAHDQQAAAKYQQISQTITSAANGIANTAMMMGMMGSMGGARAPEEPTPDPSTLPDPPTTDPFTGPRRRLGTAEEPPGSEMGTIEPEAPTPGDASVARTPPEESPTPSTVPLTPRGESSSVETSASSVARGEERARVNAVERETRSARLRDITDRHNQQIGSSLNESNGHPTGEARRLATASVNARRAADGLPPLPPLVGEATMSPEQIRLAMRRPMTHEQATSLPSRFVNYVKDLKERLRAVAGGGRRLGTSAAATPTRAMEDVFHETGETPTRALTPGGRIEIGGGSGAASGIEGGSSPIGELLSDDIDTPPVVSGDSSFAATNVNPVTQRVEAPAPRAILPATAERSPPVTAGEREANVMSAPPGGRLARDVDAPPATQMAEITAAAPPWQPISAFQAAADEGGKTFKGYGGSSTSATNVSGAMTGEGAGIGAGAGGYGSTVRTGHDLAPDAQFYSMGSGVRGEGKISPRSAAFGGVVESGFELPPPIIDAIPRAAMPAVDDMEPVAGVGIADTVASGAGPAAVRGTTARSKMFHDRLAGNTTSVFRFARGERDIVDRAATAVRAELTGGRPLNILQRRAVNQALGDMKGGGLGRPDWNPSSDWFGRFKDNYSYYMRRGTR